MGRWYNGDIEGKFWVAVQISRVSELFNYENQREKVQQVLLHRQLNSWLFSNIILKKVNKWLLD